MEKNKCGTLVTTILGKIDGMITAECKRFDRVNYEISYFNNGEPETCWMHETQFVEKGNGKQFGFISNNKSRSRVGLIPFQAFGFKDTEEVGDPGDNVCGATSCEKEAFRFFNIQGDLFCLCAEHKKEADKFKESGEKYSNG